MFEWLTERGRVVNVAEEDIDLEFVAVPEEEVVDEIDTGWDGPGDDAVPPATDEDHLKQETQDWNATTVEPGISAAHDFQYNIGEEIITGEGSVASEEDATDEEDAGKEDAEGKEDTVGEEGAAGEEDAEASNIKRPKKDTFSRGMARCSSSRIKQRSRLVVVKIQTPTTK